MRWTGKFLLDLSLQAKRSTYDNNDFYREISKAALNEAVNVKVHVSPSRISKEAGLGVFANMDIVKGSIVAFYPGYYIPPLPLWAVTTLTGDPMTHLSKPKTNSCYVIHCTNNGGYLDAAEVNFDYFNTSRVAHLINHPPKGSTANVYSIDFKWQEVFPNVDIKFDFKTLNPIGEGPWYIDQASNNCVYLHENCASHVGMVFIAKRDIVTEEELFFNYNYEKGSNVPTWYNHISEELT